MYNRQLFKNCSLMSMQNALLCGYCTYFFRNLVDLEVELAAKRAELQCLSQEATLLRENIAEALREKEILFVKYQKIQDFKEIAVRLYTHK